MIAGLNEDLAREYQAIIAYVVYSQVLKGAAYMAIAAELEVHAGQELQHALTIAKHIDYLGGTPTITPKPVAPPKDEKQMLRADLDNETKTIKDTAHGCIRRKRVTSSPSRRICARSCVRSRSTRSIWPRRSASKCRDPSTANVGRGFGLRARLQPTRRRLGDGGQPRRGQA